MAIFAPELQNIKRSDGRSSVGAAAYRSSSKLKDHRTGEMHNYERKQGVVATGIVGYSGTREELWNEVEKIENRKNSVTAREMMIPLPAELTDRQRLEIVASFAGHLRERYGCIVDYAVHRPIDGDRRNHHAHVMFTTRAYNNGWSRTKYRQLTDKASGANELKDLREVLADQINAALALAGSMERVDHRSYNEQAKAGDLPAGMEPGQKDGPAITNIKRRVVAGKQSLPGWLKDRAIASVQRVARNSSLRRLGWTILNVGQFSDDAAGRDPANDELFGAVLDGAADFLSMPSLKTSKAAPSRRAEEARPTRPVNQGKHHLEGERGAQAREHGKKRLRRRRGEKSRAKGHAR